MLQVGPFYQKMPEDWQIAQEVMFADGTSILAYNANMRLPCGGQAHGL